MKKWITKPEQYKGLRRGRIERAERNYEANKAAFVGLEGKMLHGQGGDHIKKLVYGTHSLEWCGCELIAVANTMLLTGREAQLPEIIREFELNKMHQLLPSGYFGTSPKKVKYYYDFHSYPYKTFTTAAQADEYLADNDKVCGVLGFWIAEKTGSPFKDMLFFLKGQHTVAFEKKYGKIYVYNRYNSVTSAKQFDSISDMMGTRRLIVAYVLEDKIKAL
ncbi:MAG: hypothetical protein IKR76_05880 [Ruminococcus sp.]|nr:hypothetical protein [Ruminococcus sp.]